MEDSPKLDRYLVIVTWSLLLVWWGIRWLVEFLPNGSGLVGTGLILLGLNAARWRNGIPGRSSTTTPGILALATGGLVIAASILPLPSQPSMLAIMLVVLGSALLVRGVLQPQRT